MGALKGIFIVLAIVVGVSLIVYGFTEIVLPQMLTTDTFKYEYANPQGQTIEVRALNGFIAVEYWTGSTVVIEGVRQSLLSPLDKVFSQTTASGITTWVETLGWPSGWHTIDITVKIPATMENISLLLSTKNGYVTVDAGNFSSVSATITNGYMDMTFTNCLSVTALTNTGGIKLDAKSIQNLTILSTNGDLELKYVPRLNGTYSLTTTNGLVIVNIPSYSSFSVNATTVNSKVTANGFDFASTSGDEKHLIAVSGDGSATIDITSTYGDIRLYGY